MTTIAYHSGIIAADSLITCGSRRDGYCAKIRKFGPILAGCSGSCGLSEQFWDWFSRGPSHQSVSPINGTDDALAFIVLPDDLLVEFGRDGPVRFRTAFYAIGSGAPYALGAMQMGATAIEAVAAAAHFDVNSGGPIHTLSRY